MPLASLRSVSAIAIALSPAFLLRLAWPVLTGDARIIDGVLRVSDESWVVAAGIWACWTVAVLLGAAMLDGQARPVLRVLRALPVVISCVAAIVFVALTAVFVLGPAPVILIVVLLLLIGLATALALVGIVAVVQECGFAAFAAVRALRGRWRRGGMPFVATALAPGFAVGLIMRGLPSGSTTAGLIAEVLRDVLLVAVAALQSRALIRLYRRTHPWPQADPDPPARRWVAVLGGLALLVPAAFAGGAVAAQGAPRLTVSPELSTDTVVRVGWPAGRHPVIVTMRDILDCVDDRCSDVTTTRHEVELLPDQASVIIQPDGSVVALGLHTLLICDAARKCESTVIPALASAMATAFTLTPAGVPLIATASPVKNPAGTQLSLLRCHDPRCGTSDRIMLGMAAPVQLGDEWNMRQLAIRIDEAGRPIVAFYNTGPVGYRWCETAACTQTVMGFPTSHGWSSQVVVELHRELQRPCDSECPEEFRGPAVPAPDGGIYAVEQRIRGAEGLILQAGGGEDFIETDLLRCGDRRCVDPRQRVRISVERRWSDDWRESSSPEFWMVAAGPDGRVVMVRPMVSPLVINVVTL